MLTALFLIFSFALTGAILMGALFGDIRITAAHRPEPVVYYFKPEHTQRVYRSYTTGVGYALAVNA